jgi:hypothetical protein
MIVLQTDELQAHWPNRDQSSQIEPLTKTMQKVGAFGFNRIYCMGFIGSSKAEGLPLQRHSELDQLRLCPHA